MGGPLFTRDIKVVAQASITFRSWKVCRELSEPRICPRIKAYSDVHDQLPPPFGEGSKFLNSVRASNLAWLPLTVHSNSSEAVCLAARTLLLHRRDLRQYRKFPPVRYCQISSAIAETALYSRSGRGISKRGRKRKRMLRKRTSGKF